MTRPMNGGAKGGGSSPNSASAGGKPTSSAALLAEQYPVNSLWEMTLESQETVSGRVYCTDEVSQSIVLQKPLVHTTLASEVRIIHASAIVKADKQEDNDDDAEAQSPLHRPLAKIQKKALEERERKALRLAEESFRHINQKATPKGQACFDRLLKACNEVVWKDQSILVLGQVQVDPPYEPENCKIVQRGAKKSLEDGSLERVKKIVAAESTVSSNQS